jgi:prepilin-type N-terminal cleavage/methylation domain-containing protein
LDTPIARVGRECRNPCGDPRPAQLAEALTATMDFTAMRPLHSAPQSGRKFQAGVTLMEMLVVVVLISLLVGIAVPSFQAGLPSIRLHSASSSVAQFLSAARNQVERVQRPVVLRVSPDRGTLSFQSVDAVGRRHAVSEEVAMPNGVSIQAVFPAAPGMERATREFLLFPGGGLPAFAILLGNERGAQRWVSLDPITYVPLIAAIAPPMAANDQSSAGAAP